MQPLVLFVEGDGDKLAVPVLVKRLLGEMQAWDVVSLHPSPFRVGELHRITGRRSTEWTRLLAAARKIPNVGGVLLLLDGDMRTSAGAAEFCVKRSGEALVEEAREVGAGKTFSLACVFARQEYESWLLAGVSSLAGKPLSPGGRPGVRADAVAPVGDLELAPRDAKGSMNALMTSGYNPPRDQAALTRLVDLEEIRRRQMRSFRRLESALAQLVDAIRKGEHVATP